MTEAINAARERLRPRAHSSHWNEDDWFAAGYYVRDAEIARLVAAAHVADGLLSLTYYRHRSEIADVELPGMLLDASSGLRAALAPFTEKPE